VVVIAPGRHEGRLGAVALHQLKAEHAAIEGERALEIRHLEVNMADPDARIDGPRRRLSGGVLGGRVRHRFVLQADRADSAGAAWTDPP
jgi:hypothetical protein